MSVESDGTETDKEEEEAHDVDAQTQEETVKEAASQEDVEDVADGKHVDDVVEQDEEDAPPVNVNTSTARCGAFIESTCFALTLVIIGMVMGTLLPFPAVADAAVVNPTSWQQFSLLPLQVPPWISDGLAPVFIYSPNGRERHRVQSEGGLHVTSDQTMWSLTNLGGLISLVLSLWVVALHKHLRIEKKRAEGIATLPNKISECLRAHVADGGREDDVSLQVDTMTTSLFDALIRVALLHDHQAYLAQTSLAKLTIHAVANRVLHKPSRAPRLTRTTHCSTHPRGWKLRMHPRKIVTLLLLGTAHARRTLPRVSLPVTATPERDMTLLYLAVLPLVILVPLLIFVMVAPGDDASSPKRRRTSEHSGANDEQHVQSSTTQRTPTPAEHSGVHDENMRCKEPYTCSSRGAPSYRSQSMPPASSPNSVRSASKLDRSIQNSKRLGQHDSCVRR